MTRPRRCCINDAFLTLCEKLDVFNFQHFDFDDVELVRLLP